MKLRRANEKDIPQLINMRLAYLIEDHGELPEEQNNIINEQLPEYFRKHLNHDLLAYVCEDNETIVSAVFLMITERPANPNFITGLTGTLLNVYTLPQYRRRGIAGELIKMAMQDAKRMNLSYIDLNATQLGYSLYRKLGFAPVESKYVYMKYKIN